MTEGADRLLDSVDGAQGHRQLDLVAVEDFAAAAASVRALPAGVGPFALLVLGAATGVAVDTLSAVAEASIERGCYWFGAWGPDCERVHDIVDEVILGDGTRPPLGAVLTTWHDDEPLGEVLSFFWNDACPYEGQDRGPLMLVVALAHSEWAEKVRRRAAAGLPEG